MGTSISKDGSDRKKILITSCAFMGLSHILYLKQYVKGILFMLMEILMLRFSPTLVNMVNSLIHIGRASEKNVTFRMIDGIIALVVIVICALAYYISVKSALSDYWEFCLDGRAKTNKEALQGLGGKAFPLFGLAPAFVLVMFFVVIPLAFSMLIAFTNWRGENEQTMNWIGFHNFGDMFGGNADFSSAFLDVAVWTIVWGVLATFTCYFGGMVLASFLYEAKLKITPVFRAILILPYAVPSILTVSVWSQLLATTGIINNTLIKLGIMGNAVSWLDSPDHTALHTRIVSILVNMWVGVPYFMLLITGQMTAISADVFEAATIDGANKFQTFRYITLPLVLYQTIPLVIMSFTHNVNNFGAIYFLANGKPILDHSVNSNAFGTDLMVTWLYRLSMDQNDYCRGAVLAILVFAVLAPFAIWNFRQTKSFKEGEL